ncbi:hypothetical protein [Variovorax sp. HJSM1_2]|uniref:hypothetical protein n=1 Tax=Variovorax sp. HJSM1_2 TaxID=3366263 RepID=UPI003BDE3E6F
MADFLTPEEKERIKSEELFRLEIRKELMPPAPAPATENKRQKLWKFLNSTFGMWLLSTVVVAGIVQVYNERQEKAQLALAKESQDRADERKRLENYQRVALEIAFRFSSTMARLKVISRKYGKQAQDAKAHQAVVGAFDPLAKPASDSDPPLYPEYKLYSGLAMMAELQRHAGPAEREALTEILAKTSGFIEEITSDTPLAGPNAEEIASGLLQRMRYPKWSNSGFPYTRCDEKEPFC